MSLSGRLIPALGIVFAPVVLAGCASIPEDASTKDFCSEGEKFSASTTLAQGKKAADKLAEVGTPKGIPKSARLGFVELIDRVKDAKNGADFHKKAAKLTKAEAEHLADLSTYIKETCDLS